jgi:Alkylmercury lyase
MDERDLVLRNRIYRHFADAGRAPARAEIGDDAALCRLHDAHALVLGADGEVLMANPFSAVPTRYRVDIGERFWFANCAWDAFGIPAALHEDGHVSTTCGDCGDKVEIDLRDGPQPDDYVFHVVVPAAQWWDDIVFT